MPSRNSGLKDKLIAHLRRQPDQSVPQLTKKLHLRAETTARRALGQLIEDGIVVRELSVIPCKAKNQPNKSAYLYRLVEDLTCP